MAEVQAGGPSNAVARKLDIGESEILVLADEEAVAREAAARTIQRLDGVINRRGEAHLALTGGSSAVTLYRELAQPQWRTALGWDRVHLWWSDERFVPVDHPESNAGLAYRLLLAMAARAGETGSVGAQGADVAAGDVPGLPIDPEKVHPVEVEETIGEGESAELAAQLYSEDLERLLPRGPGDLPAFDVMLAGVGPDGHILSVFPGSPALADDAPLVMAVPAPTHVEPHLARITLTPRLLPTAALVVVIATGSAKADVVGRILGDNRDPARWPAQVALLPNAVWLLDEPAASRLT